METFRIGSNDLVIENRPKFLNNIASQNTSNVAMYRGTAFRGVSRNGKESWQILTMIQGGKAYLATVDNIFYAAILYDMLSIQTKGIKAKSNFNYTKRELLALMSMDCLLHVRQQGEEADRALNRLQPQQSYHSELKGMQPSLQLKYAHKTKVMSTFAA